MSEDVVKVFEIALREKCGVLLVKDHGVYLMPDIEGKPPAIAYAEGLNPDIDGYIYDVVREKCGGDDFEEHLEHDESLFQRICQEKFDLNVSVTKTRIYLKTVRQGSLCA